LIVELGMKALQYRLSWTAASVVLATLAVSACSGREQHREAAAVREFHQRLEQGRVDLIYASSSDYLKQQLSEGQFRQFLAEARDLGRLEDSERAHYTRTAVENGPDIVLAFYNSRYSKASCLESFSWHVEKDALKLAGYSCARNMQVTCPGGVAGAKCETSPVATAALGFASVP
jgi:hypothetical protein